MNSQKPLISYVITAYNIEEFIQASIESALAQTYEPLEIILSDDCSTDNTFVIMQNMARQYTGKHKIILNRNEKNLGITLHMNKAYMELARGEIIIAAHGDDISLPERTQKSFEFLQRHAEYSAVSFSMVAIDQNGNQLENGFHSAVVSEFKTYSLDAPKKNGIPNIPAPSRAFYKTIMHKFGALWPSCPTEDELISFRSLLLGKNAFLPDVMVYYRKHKRSSSNSENFAKFSLMKIYQQQLLDMKVAVDERLLSVEKFNEINEVLKIGISKRQIYRNYFAQRNAKNLLHLLMSKHFTIKEKGHYIKEHIAALRT
ncbi:hypothetical protein SPSIL_010510 [Sporomusa silvacetica DSM 10669]|uniref:Glycosyltransferase 2-like domain-containing protein n=1 Tax=Sporomusa silvacetica DSM 10669 TaxID=1123289 RepID=A0ABZ3IGZ6_9FIRM|nr:glycosyltransferase [Sporomusa silvacetica]OZC21435.1 putative glycosyltransferase EpsE [Sporomusa silvacetica DSM 10669]